MRTNPNSLTEGSIWKNLILFALPVFLGNVFQQLYNTADSLIVSIFLGDSALAAVSSSGNLIFMFVGFFNGVAMGAGILIARYFGAKDYEQMEKTIHTNIAFGLITGTVLTILGVLFTPTILGWMGTPADVLPKSIEYFRFYFCGAIFTVMYNIFVGILHAMGDSKNPLYYLIFASFLNIALDFLFLGVFRMGVGSAALATTISQGVSTLLCCYRMLRLKGPGQLHFRRIRIHRSNLKDIVHYGLPSGIQNCVIGLANVVVQSNINAFGAAAMAGCGAYSKLEGFAFLPVTCFAQGLSTFVGQNLGARKYDRAKKGAVFGTVCSVLLAELVGVLFYLFIPYLIGVFNVSPESLDYGVRHCRTMCLLWCLLSFTHCASGILRGAGRVMVPMFTMLGCWCILRVSYITVAVQFFPRLTTVSMAYPITWTCSSIILLLYLFKSDWVHSFERTENKVSRA